MSEPVPAHPVIMTAPSGGPFQVPPDLEREIDELISHYPQKRSASLMLLHAIQERMGHISKEAMEWIAAKLELQPINIYELVTFYPMFRQQPIGRIIHDDDRSGT